MSTFQIGQLVRFVRGAKPQHMPHIGKVAQIIAANCRKGEVTNGALNCADADFLISIPSGLGGNSLVMAWQIEPIQPSGAAPSEYSFTELMDRCRAGEGLPA